MTPASPAPSFNLREVLDGELVISHYQPIVSVGRKTIVGYESLARGIHPVSRETLSPIHLFRVAHEENLPQELDEICQKMALANFRAIQTQHPDCFLSVNFESSVIDKELVRSKKFLLQVKAMGLKPENVALEIVESQVKDTDDLRDFVRTYRGYGFLIALDDIGSGHSNLNRIPLIRPDILKIDRYLVQGIQKDFYKQEVFKSLIRLAGQIGALVIAEGIETKEEALTVMELGVDLIQGFYFARPLRQDLLDDGAVQEPLRELWQSFRESLYQKLEVKQSSMRKYELLTRDMQTELEKIPTDEYEVKLHEMIHFFPQVESVYLLDEAGIQMTEAILGPGEKAVRNRVLFRPREKGANLSMRDFYYMLINAGVKKTNFVSDSYLSNSTGNLCITFSRIFHGLDGHVRVLCVDINTQFLKQFPEVS
jgi:EAL domain-containing protein (putative c-di-GMP-specific phosphodiesterase class I)